MSHIRHECKLHRVTLAQCRCPSPSKSVFYVECPKDEHGKPVHPACVTADEKEEA